MTSLELYVHERSDETLVVSRLPLHGRALPRAWGMLSALGTVTVAADALSGWVHTCLRDEGYCAVVGRDAAVVSAGLGGTADEAPATDPRPDVPSRITPILIG